MKPSENLDSIASKHLGQQGSYAVQTDYFDPSLLVPMPRELARNDWNIKGDEFIGYDIWHCHEATFLLNSGVPIAGTLKIIYPSSSKYMVESKSFKLYLNSYDMCKMGEGIEEAIKNYETQIIKDISKILECNIEVKFFSSVDYDQLKGGDSHIDGFVDLQSLISRDLKIDDYKAQKNHLTFNYHKSFDSEELKLYTNVLRSRCRHTKQKDTGQAYIYLKLKPGASIDVDSIFKQIVSLRMVDEFHEFCAEKLFIDLKKHTEVDQCCVMLLYSRRGSLDINPVRSTDISLISPYLININNYTKKTQGQ